ncbi:zinc finger protein 37 homolog [Rana temporaria]|uniref:zinc finger protein 37 homolog n=1 Tax=Rana temporaria TaxID=8407 RepID=UPI001AAD258C|nr:zinc finger protein 37 homolog [Rana temporaria]
MHNDFLQSSNQSSDFTKTYSSYSSGFGGRGYEIAKKASGEQLPYNYQRGMSLTSVPYPYFWKPEIKYKQKILEATRKIIDLLAGEEDHTIPHYHKDAELKDIKAEIKEEEEEMSINKAQQSIGGGGHLYSRDSTQEDHIPHHHQHEELADVKVEIKEEEVETYVSSDHWPAENVMIMKSPIEEESSLDISTDGHCVQDSSEGLFLSSPYRNAEDFVVQYSPVVHSITYNIHHRPDHLKQSMDPSNPEESSHSVTPEIHVKSQSTEGSTGLSDPQESSLSHTGDTLFSCTVCGNSFTELGELLIHQKTHRDQRSFPCSECGKIFSQERSLLRHLRVHTGAVAQRPNPEAASRLHERHFPDILQPTPTQRAPQRRCRVCSKRGMRRDTRYYCPSCPNHPGLCIKNCFRRYHTLVNY